jgi:tetratricopeptide (TPR) repeat protein
VLDWASSWSPPTHAGHLHRARYLEQRGDTSAAAAERAAADRLPPRTALDWFLAGHDHLLHRADPRAALDDFDRALRDEPDLFWALFLRALSWRQLQNSAEARAALGACVRERPDFVWGYLLRGLLSGQAGDFVAAADDFARAEALARDDSARYVLHIHRGLVSLRQGRVQPAIDELRAAVRLKPGLYPGHVNLAQALVDRQDLDGAVAEMTTALGLEPGRPELYRTRARMHLLRHDDAAARADLDEAIRLGQGLALARDLYERGLLLCRAGHYADAARDAAAALELAPEFALAWRLCGEVHLQQGRPREALDAFGHYLDLDKAPDAEVYLLRARARVELGDFTRLPAEYRYALALRPHADVYAALGWAHVVNEALPLARCDFDDALRLDPRHADALTGRGLVRAMAGDHRRGVDDAEAGLRHGTPSARLSYNAARVYAQAAVAVAADPRGAEAAELRQRYEDRGVRLLAEALGQVPAGQRPGFWRNNVVPDRALVPLRRSPAFDRLAAPFAGR